MTDTKRTLSVLQGLFANNGTKAITAQRIRDFLVSVLGSRPQATVTADTVLNDDAEIVLVDASGGNRIITLPALAAGIANKVFTIKKADTSANWVRIVPDNPGTQSIDGHNRAYLILPYSEIRLITDGSNWFVLSPSNALQKVIYALTANGQVQNTTTETSVIGTGQGAALIPPELLRVGRSVHIKARGFMEVTATPTIRLRLKLNSVTILDSTAITLAAVTDGFFEFEAVLTCRVIGAGGQITAQGAAWYGANAGSALPLISTAAISLDTTANQPIDLTAQWSAASADNNLVITNLEIGVSN